MRWICTCLALAMIPASEARAVSLSVHNAGPSARREVVCVSVPVAAGAMTGPVPQAVRVQGRSVAAQAAVVTRHPDQSARRVMVCFPVELAPGQRLEAEYGPEPGSAKPAAPSNSPPNSTPMYQDGRLQTRAYDVLVQGDRVQIVKPGSNEPLATLSEFGPASTGVKPATTEILYDGPHFVWLRWRQQGEDWGREVDVQADRFGRITLTHRLQSHQGENAWTPDFGFELSALNAKAAGGPREAVHFLAMDPRSHFAEHPELAVGLTLADATALALSNPLALRQHRGTLAVKQDGESLVVRAGRLEPVSRENDELMIQDGQWRIVQVMIQPGRTAEQAAADLAAAIDHPLEAHADAAAYDAVYRTGPPLEVKHPVLRSLSDRYVCHLQRLSIDGDDWGNMTSYDPLADKAAINSMVRYNHCQYVWEDYFRTGDLRLLKVARDWSENYRNLSVYWGRKAEYYGGGRRGRAYRDDPEKGAGPGSYMVRFEYVRDYVTKGYRNFWLAYEETGDPRFKEAAEAQAAWSAANVHSDRGEMRNVGMIADFAKLYEYTGQRTYLEQAERLWREFQSKQMPDLMFTQSGKPATGNDLYIFDDNFGYKHPFYKAYITQYATNALPQLLRWRPDDRRLHDTILACNDWMGQAQTAGGGWSYPGPTSAGMRWSIEYCHGLAVAYTIEPKPAYLDAIQRTLRAVVALFQTHGEISAWLEGWEAAQGIKLTATTYRLGTDRDRAKDYTQGRIKFSTSPDDAVHFLVLLRDYLRYRGEDTLFQTDPVLEQIRKLPSSKSR